MNYWKITFHNCWDSTIGLLALGKKCLSTLLIINSSYMLVKLIGMSTSFSPQDVFIPDSEAQIGSCTGGL